MRIDFVPIGWNFEINGKHVRICGNALHTALYRLGCKCERNHIEPQRINITETKKFKTYPAFERWAAGVKP